MSDDYMWDPSASADAETERLERILKHARYRPATERLAFRLGGLRPRRAAPVWMRLAAALAVAGAVSGAWMLWSARTAAWDVQVSGGVARIASRPVTGAARLGVGEWLETDPDASARVRVGVIGQVEVAPGTRVGLVSAGLLEKRMSLSRGTIHAMIFAPPRRFFVNTPWAVAVDLGCAYSLSVENNGDGLLRVTAGWVGFQAGGRESFIPAGAACRTSAGTGPGTPFYLDSSDELQQALAELDSVSTAPWPRLALERVLAEARQRDGVTLWHLLFRVPPAERVLVYQRFSELLPVPPEMEKDAVLRLERRAMDRLWNALGLGPMQWWRRWKWPWAMLTPTG